MVGYDNIQKLWEEEMYGIKRQAEMLANARAKSNPKISQEKMAEYLGISKNSVYNVEAGKKELNILETINWLNVCGINMFRPIIEFCYPDELYGIKQSDSDEKIKNALHQIADNVPNHYSRAVEFIINGSHGSNPSAVIDEISAYLQTPIFDRHNVSTTIIANYKRSLLNHDSETYSSYSEPPNLDTLEKATNASWYAVENNKSAYSLTIEEKGQFIKAFSRFLAKIRTDSGVSQEQMAFTLNMSKNTISNIENGRRVLSLWESIKWFKICGFTNYIRLFQFLFPDYYAGDVEKDDFNRIAHENVNNLNNHYTRLLLFLFLGEHGSDPYAVIDEFIANLYCPIEDRYNIANQIKNNYKRVQITDSYSSKEHEMPNMEEFERAIEECWGAISNRKNKYVE